VPRPPSIHLRLARVLERSLKRFEVKLNSDEEYIPTEPESRILVNLAKADHLMRGREVSDEEKDDLDEAGTKEEEKERSAADLVSKLTQAVRSGTAAKALTPTEREEEKQK